MGLKYYNILLFVSSLIVISCEGQMHFLKFVNTGVSPDSVEAQFNSGMSRSQLSNVKNRFSKADRICINGMWALYNTTDFGEGVEDSTTVISVRGTDIDTCTNTGQIPVLRNVQSLIYLGNADYSQDGMVIYSQPYLLGGVWNAVTTGGMISELPASISGFSLGSIAITGSKSWLICADRDTPCSNGVCVNMKKYSNRFLQRNPAKDNSQVITWPKTVRKVQMAADADECAKYPNPPPLNTRRLFKRHTSDGIQISVDELSS